MHQPLPNSQMIHTSQRLGTHAAPPRRTPTMSSTTPNPWLGLEELVKAWNTYLRAENTATEITAVKQNIEVVTLNEKLIAVIFWKAGCLTTLSNSTCPEVNESPLPSKWLPFLLLISVGSNTIHHGRILVPSPLYQISDKILLFFLP